MPVSILVVDDDDAIRELLSFHLGRAGYAVRAVSTGEEALQVARALLPDMVILDLVLPGIDGFTVCRELRREAAMPILILSARDEEIDRVVAFEVGADDFVVKPFSPRELVGRVKAILRRAGHRPLHDAEPPADEVTFGALTVNFRTYEVTLHGRTVALTPKEYQILKVLVQSPGRVFSRDELVMQMMGASYAGEARVVDVHIRHLRTKLETDPANPAWIQTVRGAGYKFAAARCG